MDAWGDDLAADIATDALTYTTFGAKHALTPIGAAVMKTGALKGFTGKAMLEAFHGVEPAMLQAGQTASDVAQAVDKGQRIAQRAAASTGFQVGQPLASLAHFGLPFGGPVVNVGTGKTAQRIADRLDKAGDFLRFGNPWAGLSARFSITSIMERQTPSHSAVRPTTFTRLSRRSRVSQA